MSHYDEAAQCCVGERKANYGMNQLGCGAKGSYSETKIGTPVTLYEVIDHASKEAAALEEVVSILISKLGGLLRDDDSKDCGTAPRPGGPNLVTSVVSITDANECSRRRLTSIIDRLAL